jgi:hypothetical protein
MLRLPTKFLEMRQVGETLSPVHDAANVREAVSGKTLTAVADGVMVILYVAVLWIYGVRRRFQSTNSPRAIIFGKNAASAGHAESRFRNDLCKTGKRFPPKQSPDPWLLGRQRHV